MIVKFDGTKYHFIKNDNLINILYQHEIENILKQPERMENIKYRSMCLCFPEVLGSVNLIDLYEVAHPELKLILATYIFKDLSKLIEHQSNIIERLKHK